MKIFVVLAALTAFAMASPSPALRYVEKRDGFGQYALFYETDEGTIVEQHGRLIPGPQGHVMVMGGRTTFRAPDGQTFVTTWGSDLDGYKAVGEHLPKEVRSVIAAI